MPPPGLGGTVISLPAPGRDPTPAHDPAHQDHEHDHDHDHDGHDHGEHGHHDHGHEHDHAHREEDRRIRVLHGASPFCWWSYGYEGVIQRLRLRYGEQIKVNVYQIPVYEDSEEHHRSYGTDDPATLREWAGEAAQRMGLPVDLAAVAAQPRSCVPGTRMVHAAELAAPGAGERLARRLGFLATAANPERLDLGDEATLLRLAEQCGAPRKAVEQALAGGAAERSLAEDAQSMHALGLNFFALQLRDDEERTITIDHAFDPAKVEEALEWLARGKLHRRALPPLDVYARGHAPVSLRELRQVFDLDEAAVLRALAPLERAGVLRRAEVQGHPFWHPPGG